MNLIILADIIGTIIVGFLLNYLYRLLNDYKNNKGPCEELNYKLLKDSNKELGKVSKKCQKKRRTR